MRLSEDFPRCIFSPATIRMALAKLPHELTSTEGLGKASVGVGNQDWQFDNLEEFFAAYQQGFRRADLTYYRIGQDDKFSITAENREWSIKTSVAVQRKTRSEIEEVMAVFRESVDSVRIPEPPAPPPEQPIVFIGHGHSQLWRDLKDHLHEQHGYQVKTYETGARAGHAVRDALDNMSREATFAVLLMTGEDEQADGQLRARENVVHEVGLFQGRLGFERAIVALENGVEPFSNLQGIQQLRFSSGNVREIFGDVLATLRREFQSRS
jgi:predicted nucleotide-binding protein